MAGERIVLVSTHVVSDIQSVADEIILLKKGNAVDHGPVRRLCEKYGGTEDLEQVYLQVFGEVNDADLV